MLLALKGIIIILILNRREVNGHGENGNDLQTTPGFRAHVAKKLGAMLDRYWYAVLKNFVLGSTTVMLLCAKPRKFKIRVQPACGEVVSLLVSFIPTFNVNSQYSVS